jgi:hypothetical protein
MRAAVTGNENETGFAIRANLTQFPTAVAVEDLIKKAFAAAGTALPK